jgi:hypothetical protein
MRTTWLNLSGGRSADTDIEHGMVSASVLSRQFPEPVRILDLVQTENDERY